MSYVWILMTVGLLLQVAYSHCETTANKPSTETSTKTTVRNENVTTTTPNATTATSATTENTTSTTTTTIEHTTATSSTNETTTSTSTPTTTTTVEPTTATSSTNETTTSTSTPTATTTVGPTTAASSRNETTTLTATPTLNVSLDTTTSTPIDSTTAIVQDPCGMKDCNNGSCIVDGENGVCNCSPGFTGETCDQDIDECTTGNNTCNVNANCTNTEGSFTCICKSGWTGNGSSCTDIDECSGNPCDVWANCTNSPGSYSCDCQSGFTGNGTTCEDIDECTTGNSTCNVNANCTNTKGSFTCICKSGWTGNGSSCTDIDECSGNPCDVWANCTNSPGSYSCDCQSGFTGNGTTCEDIDECTTGNSTCNVNANCTNTEGSFTCICKSGWTGNGSSCTDIDECSGNPCDVWANCTNSPGSYSCDCQSGFTGNGTTCEDVNECNSNETNNCESNNTLYCLNLVGHYFCQCYPGWTGDNCTEENDLCASNPCSPNATCSYNTSGVTCVCKDEFRGNGTTCFRKVLLEYYDSKVSQHMGDDEIYGPCDIPGGLPYNGIVYSKIYVSINGYVSLGQPFNGKYPTFDNKSKTLTAFPLIAPLWADIEIKNVTRQGGLNITTGLNATKINEDFSSPLEAPRYAFMATWKNAVPYPYEENKNAEVADFQLVLLTNGTSTKLMLNYDQEFFTWKLSPGRKVAAGFTSENDMWQVLAGEDNYTQIYKTNTNGVDGRLEFDIQNNNDKLKSESSCYAWLQTINNTILEEALNDQDACPCSIGQATRDRRFKNNGGHVYKSRFSKARGSRQMCRYSESGFLMTGVPNGGYMDIQALNTSDGHKHCCVSSSRLCTQFYHTLPSNTCQYYRPPSWSLTWGDPHLNTIDGLNYTFNGRGEYTLIQYDSENTTQTTEVQVRTEFVHENTTDATVFVGLAARVGTGSVLELNLNRTNGYLNIYIDGKKKVDFNGSSTVNQTNDSFEIFNDEGHLIVALASGTNVLVKASNILDITTNVPKDVKTKGLLGNNDGDPNDDFVTRNGHEYPKSSNESAIYEMASTWRVENTTSLFNYTISGHEYEFFNNDTIPLPTFLSEINITEYMEANCGAEINTSSCNKDIACEVDTILTCDLRFGENTKQTADDAKNEVDILEHLPPALLPNAPEIYLGFKFNTTAVIDIRSLFNGTNLTFQMNISNSEAPLSTFEDDHFTLNASSLLRDDLEPFSVKFVAKDSMNASTEYWPNIYYCGCETEDECDYTQVMVFSGVSDRFHVATCKCTNNRTGLFCEKINCNCYNEINAATCECGCPDGMESVNAEGKCYDVDECNQNRCSQTCYNTIGRYHCNCTQGYTLNTDGRTCDDVNECADQSSICTDIGQYCKNTHGSYQCMCLPGYVKETNGSCYTVASSFAGVLTFTIVTTIPNDIDDFVRRWVISIFNSTSNNPKVEVNVTEIPASRGIESVTCSHDAIKRENMMRRKREEVKKSSYRSEFTLHFGDTQSTKNVTGIFEDYITKYKDGNTVFDKTLLRVDFTGSKLFSDEDGGICNIVDKTDCDLVSTSCKSTNGTFECACKSGFKLNPMSSKRCIDIDECKDENICSNSNGNCTNKHGYFDCTCKPGFIFDGRIGCTDLCQPNPCINGGYCEHGEQEGLFICKCDDKWTGPRCETENSEILRLRTIAIAVGTSVGCVCILLLFIMIGMYRRDKARRMGYSRRPLSAFDDFSLTRSSHFTKTNIPLDDGDDDLQGDESTFTIPRPMVRSSEYNSIEGTSTRTTVYDGYAGKEEDNQPLTSSKAAGDDDEKMGVSNSSFLHRDERKPQRSSKNPYEYF